mmetsp:Transcript_116334/g.237986  ORF Transcript_116334/g.237986 Transcript_116334/m.237986 type:complete len:185 (-) Transcript_116334:409-963(-)
MDSDTCLLTERRPGKRNRVPRRAATGHWIRSDRNRTAHANRFVNFLLTVALPTAFVDEIERRNPANPKKGRNEHASVDRNGRSIDRTTALARRSRISMATSGVALFKDATEPPPNRTPASLHGGEKAPARNDPAHSCKPAWSGLDGASAHRGAFVSVIVVLGYRLQPWNKSIEWLKQKPIALYP